MEKLMQRNAETTLTSTQFDDHIYTEDVPILTERLSAIELQALSPQPNRQKGTKKTSRLNILGLIIPKYLDRRKSENTKEAFLSQEA